MATAAASGHNAASLIGNVTQASVPGPIGLIFSSVIFSAKTGLDYRRYKQGKMTKEEFTQTTKKSAFATTGSLVGTTGGMVGGFIVG